MTPNSTKRSEFKVKKGRYEQFIRQSLAAREFKFLSINWKKRTVHYLDKTGRKQVQPFWG